MAERATIVLAVTVQEKDEPTIDGVAPQLPPEELLALVISDHMGDMTRREAAYGWRVMDVREPRPGDVFGHRGAQVRLTRMLREEEPGDV